MRVPGGSAVTAARTSTPRATSSPNHAPPAAMCTTRNQRRPFLDRRRPGTLGAGGAAAPATPGVSTSRSRSVRFSCVRFSHHTELVVMDVVVPTTGDEALPGPNGIRILEDGSNTGHRIGCLEARLPPGSGGPPQHIHRAHSETFYVVSGTMRFTSADRDVDVAAGGVVTAPIGAPHTFSNPDPEEWAVFVCALAPDLYIGYFREMTALAARDGRVDHDAVLAVMARYATEPYRSGS